MNRLYPKGRQGFLEGTIDWDTDTIKIVLLTSAYTYADAHDNLNDVGAGARVATSGALTAKTVTDGVADAADVTFSAIPAGSTIVAIVVYKDSGVESTSRLIAYMDTKADSTAISVATNGGDIVVQWNAAGLFTL